MTKLQIFANISDKPNTQTPLSVRQHQPCPSGVNQINLPTPLLTWQSPPHPPPTSPRLHLPLPLPPSTMAKLTSELLRPVDPAHALDEAALLRYAAANVPGFPGPAPALALTQFGHGQSNPTYCIQASAPGGGGRTARYVLRKKPPGSILQSAHAVEREYQVRPPIPFPRFSAPSSFRFPPADPIRRVRIWFVIRSPRSFSVLARIGIVHALLSVLALVWQDQCF